MSGAVHTTDVAIIGAGPVGLFAVFELGMLKINCHVIDALDSVGGQCAALYPEKPIYDIPGYPSIDALELIKKLEAQAAPFNPTYHLGQQVTSIIVPPTGVGHTKQGSYNESMLSEEGSNNSSDTLFPPSKPADADLTPPLGGSGLWQLTTSAGTTIHCKAVIIAAGCGAFGPNRPPLDGLEAYEDSGAIRYLVTRKEEFRDTKVVIAGGGDSAIDWVNVLADVTDKLYLVHRRDKFRAAPDSVDKMRTLVEAGKLELVVPYQLDGLEGDGKALNGVRVKTLDGETRILEADYLLPFYGLSMDLGPIAEWGLNLDKNYITVDPGTCETSTSSIFAIGDIATYQHKLKLILCGFSEAALAAHAIREIVYPGEAYHFEYSTTSGVPGEAA